MRSKLIYAAALVALGGSFGCKQRGGGDAGEAATVSDIQEAPDLWAGIEDHVDLEDLQQWKTFLSTAERDPNVIRSTIQDAAKEFGVPAEILMAIAQVETNWTHIGPSIDRGWGMMHLVENHYMHTLSEAAALIKKSPDDLKSNMKDNVRGMAALLASKATPTVKKSKKLGDWFPAVKAVTGLDGDALQTQRALAYFKVLQNGVKSRTVFETTVEIPAVKNLAFKAPVIMENEAAAEYPGAVQDYIPCNFTEGRNHKVDTWTNHYIAVGSVEGMRSWFKNCSANASAHFGIAQDGKVYQFRPSTDTTWHAGSKYNKNFPYNNHRSISVEHEVLATHPEMWQSEKMLDASVELANHYIAKYGIPKKHTKGDNDEPGIRGHQEMPGTATSCPGPIPWDKWFAKLGGATTAPAKGLLTGVIYKGGNKDDRVPGAKVSLNTGTTVTADANGVYIFKDLAPGDYTATVTADGLGTKSVTRKVNAGETIWGSIGF